MGKFEQPTSPAEYLNSLEDLPAVLRARKFYQKHSGKTNNLTPTDQQAIMEQIESMKLPWQASSSEVFNILMKAGVFTLAPTEPTVQPEPAPTIKATTNITNAPRLPGLKILGTLELTRRPQQQTKPEPTPEPVAYSHRPTEPVRPVQLTAEKQAILDANNARAAKEQEYSKFYKDKNISELISQIGDFYVFDDSAEQELLDQFKDIYSDATIRTNSNNLRQLLAVMIKQSQESENPALLEYMKKLSILAERGLAHAISALDWFGQNKYLVPAHIYDDIYAGTDCVLFDRITPTTANYIVGMDATFAAINESTYEHKIIDILDHIRQGQMTQLRYQSDEAGKPLRGIKLPTLVVHFDSKTLDALIHITDNTLHNRDNAEYRNPINGHPILLQLIEQTQVFLQYAQSCNSALVPEYADTLRKLRAIAGKVNLNIPTQSTLPTTKRIREIIGRYELEHKQS
jgi:hypothetical protein